MKIEQFWMVYGLQHGAPTARHSSRSRAAAEARRLAQKHPGVTFVVLEAVETVTMQEFVTVSFREDDHIPF